MTGLREITATAFRRQPKHRRLVRERNRRFRLGALATLCSQVIGIGGQLLLVPLFLGYWGEALYGEWLTLAAAAGYLTVLDFGVQMYVVNRLNACYSRGEIGAYTRILHSALYFSLLLSALALALVGAAAWALPLADRFGFATTSNGTTRLIVALLALQIIAAVPQGIVRGIYRTVGEYARGTMIANLQRLGLVLLTAGVLVAGGGLIGVAAVQLIPLLGVILFVLRDLRRRHPEVELGVRERDLRLALTFLGPSSLFFLLQAAMVTGLQASTVLVSLSLGAGSVALFATTRTLANLVRQFASVLTNALWPELTMLEAQGQHRTLQTVHQLSIKVVTLLSLTAALFLRHAGADVYALWTQDALSYDPELMYAFLAVLVLQTPWMTSMVTLVSSNNHQVLSVLWLFATLGGLALGRFLMIEHGLPGLVLGMGAVELLVCGTYVPWASCRLIRQPLRRFVASVFGLGLLVCGGVAVLGELLIAALPVLPPIPRTLIVGVLITAATTTAGYVLWLDTSEKQRVQSLLVHRGGSL